MPSPTTKLAGQHISLSPLAFWKLFLWAVSFRTPMPVTEVMVFETPPGKTGYYVCPRCSITMEYDFTSFCSRCGQHLSWKNYKKAKLVFPGKK